MRVAIIDLGTNSVRFDIHEIYSGRPSKCLYREKFMVRLGQNVFIQGTLCPDAVRRTLQAFQSFKKTAASFSVVKTIAFGTSALRDAADREKFVHTIQKKTGIFIQVISGEQEARYIAQGVLHSLKSAPSGIFALVDIGGGSTEVSICQGREVLTSASFNLGAARLQQVFLKTIPPRTEAGHLDAIETLRHHIRSTLLPKITEEKWPKAETLIGSSGTIQALARIASNGKKNAARFDRKNLKKRVKQMSTLSADELLLIPGVEAKRVDLILAGGILLEEVAHCLGSKTFLTTESSLREGLLLEEINLIQQNKTSHLGFHLPDLIEKAKSLGSYNLHTKQVVALSESLFEHLAPLHHLSAEWKPYLTAAAILHDVGLNISPSHHAKHSAYVVQHSHFLGMEPWETDFISSLCLWHAETKLENKKIPFQTKPRLKLTFRKILALLQISDSLDRGHKNLVEIEKVKINATDVSLQLTCRAPIDLELLRIEQKKALFESVFHRKLILRVHTHSHSK